MQNTHELIEYMNRNQVDPSVIEEVLRYVNNLNNENIRLRINLESIQKSSWIFAKANSISLKQESVTNNQDIEKILDEWVYAINNIGDIIHSDITWVCADSYGTQDFGYEEMPYFRNTGGIWWGRPASNRKPFPPTGIKIPTGYHHRAIARKIGDHWSLYMGDIERQ